MWNIRILILALFLCSFARGQFIIDSYRYAVSCTPDANELHTQSNAVSDPNCNESNNTTGWTGFGGTLSSVSIDEQVGGHHFSIESSDGSSDRAQYTFSATNGNTYRVTVRAKAAVGTDARIATWAGFSSSPNTILTSTWTDYEFNVTANATGTATIRIYAAQSVGSAGDTAYFDNFSLVDTTP